MYINVFYTTSGSCFVHGDIHTTKRSADKEAASFSGRTGYIHVGADNAIVKRPAKGELAWNRKIAKLQAEQDRLANVT